MGFEFLARRKKSPVQCNFFCLRQPVVHNNYLSLVLEARMNNEAYSEKTLDRI